MWARTWWPCHIALLMADVDAVGAGVLADDQQFLRPRGDQLLRLAQHRVDPPAGELAAQLRDDAEGAGVVAALGNLEVAVMARGQLDVGQGWGTRSTNGPCVGGAASCTASTTSSYWCAPVIARTCGKRARIVVRLLAHAAGDDHPAVLGNRLADRLEAFLLGAVEEAAGVDQHDVGAGVVGAHRIAVGAQPGQDALGIDQRLGTAEADHADFAALLGDSRCHDARAPTPGAAIALDAQCKGSVEERQ